MSVLTRKILPPVFGIATIGWIIGGTIWFDTHQSGRPLLNVVSTSIVNRSIAVSHNILPSSSTCCNSTNFQPLNLFFKKDKFRFAENEELQTYFKDLNAYLQHNPTGRLKIAAFQSDTEGAKISKKRLTFVTEFLVDRKINVAQIIFEDGKKNSNTAIMNANAENYQRVEIRLIMP